MNLLRSTIFGLILSCGFGTQISAAAPATIQDYEFHQERMRLTSDSVIAISSFDSKDHVTAYTHYGIRLWNAVFHAKILSWDISGDLVFVFSKDRQGHSTYITCINRYTGEQIWQKP
ncbi:MAG: hypothetical protein H0U49_06760 [Parachlamydiaceae bacterium]|nr:hypothetical protein [Parachlamydiaceae bacterium]